MREQVFNTHLYRDQWELNYERLRELYSDHTKWLWKNPLEEQIRHCTKRNERSAERARTCMTYYIIWNPENATITNVFHRSHVWNSIEMGNIVMAVIRKHGEVMKVIKYPLKDAIPLHMTLSFPVEHISEDGFNEH